MRPLLSGSGKFETLCERMQRENCSACAASLRCCRRTGSGASAGRCGWPLGSGGAVRKLGQGDLVELSAAVGVGEVRDAVRGDAVGEGECLLGRRRLRAGRPSRIRSAARTAGGWAGAARRGQQDQGGRGDDSGSGSHRGSRGRHLTRIRAFNTVPARVFC